MPIISICLITYNREKYLKEAIDSILSQSFLDWELIIIDNGSSDGSIKKIIKPYLTKDSRIKLYLNNDNRIAFSRNLALKKCSGKYIAVLDSDDVWCDKEKLKKQYNFLINNPDYKLVGGLGLLIDQDSKIIGEINHQISNEAIKSKMFFYNNFIHSSVLFNKFVAINCGGYDESLNIGEDYDLWLKIGQDNKIFNIPEKFVKYRVHTDNVGQENDYSFKIKNYINNVKIISKYKKYYPKYFYNIVKLYYSILKSLLRIN